MTALDIETPRVFKPLLEEARYLAAHGGRGSGKSHFFAELLVERAYREPGLRAVCIREVQKSLKQSVKQLLEDKIKRLGLLDHFDILESEIRTPGDGLIVFQGMQNHTASSIKSLEGFDVAWVEEAQTLSQKSLDLLRPTIRKEGSQIWFSWNPENDFDPVDRFLRGMNRPIDAIVVQANYLDNPWLPKELLAEAKLDEQDPDKFAHVWLGQYAKAVVGAYYADDLRKAEAEGRITSLSIDPVLPLRAAWDLGYADATTIWVYQNVGSRIQILDYIEGERQPLSYYLNELRLRGYEQAICMLPHDGAHGNAVTGNTYESHVKAAGFRTEVVKNQGKGAAKMRIEAARRWFARMWFDAAKTEAGRKALAAYHERYDEDRQIGLGPEHDWASHGADSFGLIAVTYKEPTAFVYTPPKRDLRQYV